MSETGAPIRLFASLLLFWLLLNASLTLESLAIGVVVAGVIAVFMSANLSYLSGYRLSCGLADGDDRLSVFLPARTGQGQPVPWPSSCCSRSCPSDPAIVRIRTGLKHPTARLLLANAITLTPGTLSVEIKGEWLYIHWVVAETDDLEAATRAIAAGFERYLEVMYG